MSPDIFALEAVIWPNEFKTKSPSLSFICVEFTSNPPIDADTNLAKPCEVICDFGEPPVGVEILLADKSPSIVTSSVIIPPCSKNLEPVNPPSALSISPPIELDIKVCPISKPPISPSLLVILPLKLAFDAVIFPSFVKWKFEELISKLPPLPLINWACPPKKNLSPRMFTFEPLKKTLSDFKTNDLVDEPSPPLTLCPKEIKLLSSALNRKPPLADINAVNSELL